jgi:hypothetical protein
VRPTPKEDERLSFWCAAREGNEVVASIVGIPGGITENDIMVLLEKSSFFNIGPSNTEKDGRFWVDKVGTTLGGNTGTELLKIIIK